MELDENIDGDSANSNELCDINPYGALYLDSKKDNLFFNGEFLGDRKGQEAEPVHENTIFKKEQSDCKTINLNNKTVVFSRLTPSKNYNYSFKKVLNNNLYEDGRIFKNENLCQEESLITSGAFNPLEDSKSTMVNHSHYKPYHYQDQENANNSFPYFYTLSERVKNSMSKEWREIYTKNDQYRGINEYSTFGSHYITKNRKPENSMCNFCYVTESKYWRVVNGIFLCNACGLYHRKYGKRRPKYLIARHQFRKKKNQKKRKE